MVFQGKSGDWKAFRIEGGPIGYGRTKEQAKKDLEETERFVRIGNMGKLEGKIAPLDNESKFDTIVEEREKV